MDEVAYSKHTDDQLILALLLYFLELLIITIMHMGIGPRQEE